MAKEDSPTGWQLCNLYSLISISTEDENDLVPLDNFYVYEVVLENQVVGLHMKAWDDINIKVQTEQTSNINALALESRQRENYL